ncbi:hypothetical protein TNIN_131841 [Trichonephila inaurata madagascariensis]|uniref:Uncharacterized protein n=1 Tax=Trichonephila inaurata madagascariensis TaxID=2747483 RepID=A0A8X6ITJ1_9ARAC|nr:hypothetical protein TNIN_114381 [Trichonephila inaurata madagascariensis]GFY76590.1 hypothetical protein TNIN_131841 [Trichonephila inaurata madagascariensis]
MSAVVFARLPSCFVASADDYEAFSCSDIVRAFDRDGSFSFSCTHMQQYLTYEPYLKKNKIRFEFLLHPVIFESPNRYKSHQNAEVKILCKSTR